MFVILNCSFIYFHISLKVFMCSILNRWHFFILNCFCASRFFTTFSNEIDFKIGIISSQNWKCLELFFRDPLRTFAVSWYEWPLKESYNLSKTSRSAVSSHSTGKILRSVTRKDYLNCQPIKIFFL